MLKFILPIDNRLFFIGFSILLITIINPHPGMAHFLKYATSPCFITLLHFKQERKKTLIIKMTEKKERANKAKSDERKGRQKKRNIRK